MSNETIQELAMTLAAGFCGSRNSEGACTHPESSGKQERGRMKIEHLRSKCALYSDYSGYGYDCPIVGALISLMKRLGLKETP